MDGEIDPDELAALLDDDEDRDRRRRRHRPPDRRHPRSPRVRPRAHSRQRVHSLPGADDPYRGTGGRRSDRHRLPHGVASRQAAQLIGSYAGTQNVRVDSLRGGIEAWERDVGALVPTAADGADGTERTRPQTPTKARTPLLNSLSHPVTSPPTATRERRTGDDYRDEGDRRTEPGAPSAESGLSFRRPPSSTPRRRGRRRVRSHS